MTASIESTLPTRWDGTAKQLFDAIRKWESDNGESFTDYFMHDRVLPVSWSFWLLGKGYSDRANTLIDMLQAGKKYIDQDLLFHIHMDGEWDEELFNKDAMLWAEFLSASRRYYTEVIKWFEEYGNDSGSEE